jgi:hypothetical protein
MDDRKEALWRSAWCKKLNSADADSENAKEYIGLDVQGGTRREKRFKMVSRARADGGELDSA